MLLYVEVELLLDWLGNPDFLSTLADVDPRRDEIVEISRVFCASRPLSHLEQNVSQRLS